MGIKAVAELELISQIIQENLQVVQKDLVDAQNGGRDDGAVAGSALDALQLGQSLPTTPTNEPSSEEKVAKSMAINETKLLSGEGCVECLNKGNRYCFLRFVKKENASAAKNVTQVGGANNMTSISYPRNLSGLPVSTGNGKCCYSDDIFTPGCDPIGIKEWEKDARFKSFNIQLVCAQGQDPSSPSLSMPKSYRESRDGQPIVVNSSQPYEMCPHYPEQCDSRDTLKANSYSSMRIKQSEMAEAEYYPNDPYRVNVSDDQQWKQVKIDSRNGTVCSYKFEYPRSESNIY